MEYRFDWQAPFGTLEVTCNGDALTGIVFLPDTRRASAVETAFAREVYRQLGAYFADPDFGFDLPLEFSGTAHQRRVWQLMCGIPRGSLKSYGEVASMLDSSPLAVGQACGANPLPVIIPCHRVVSKAGLGGFSNQRTGAMLEIKRWLLAHEGAI